MKSFFGYACSELDLHIIAKELNSPYAGYKNAPTEVTWQLQKEFKLLGPFRLVTAKINGELGYLFLLGHDNCNEEDLPLELLERMEEVFGGGPLHFKDDTEQGEWAFTYEGNVIEIGSVVISNLYH